MRWRRRHRPGPAAVAATGLALALLAAGCGGDGSGGATPSGLAQAGSGGTLTWALAGRPRELDPLLATSRPDQLVVRQVYEPLVEQLAGPFGDVRVRPGLATPATGDETVWRLRLRGGVRFQDGALLDGSAVLANVRRWLSTPEGRGLLPDLVTADAPQPDLVRFFLSRRDPNFSADLSSPRLGIVSPQALHPRSGERARLRRDERAGTGAFEIRESSPDEVVVARNVDWWGTPRGLGPALDQVIFDTLPAPGERYRLLRAGDVEAADELPPEQLDHLRHDPLLTSLPGPGDTVLGLERSVRGIESGREIPVLSGVWLTTLPMG